MDGKLFHTLGPAIIKALSPLTMFDFGTWSRLAPVDRRVLDTECGNGIGKPKDYRTFHNILFGVSIYCGKCVVFDREMTLTLVFDLEMTLTLMKTLQHGIIA